MDFLTGSSPLDAITKKYARGLSSEYNDVHPGYISSIAEDKLRTLSEIEAAENATLILNAYIFRRFKYQRDNKPRKIMGMFKSEFSGAKTPLPEEKEMVKMFKAFIFSIRSNVYNYAPTSWSIMEEPEAGWLGELVAEPASIFDGL
jgi:hypothetical protein